MCALGLALGACDGSTTPSDAAGDADVATASPAPGTVGEDAVLTALAAVERYLDGGDLASAETVAARLVEQTPRDVRALEVLGRVLVSRALEAAGRGEPADPWYERAHEAYRSAAEIDGGSAGLWQNAGSVAAIMGQDEAALAHYLRAEAIDPSNPQHPLFAAQMLIKAGRMDEAEATLQRVLAIDDDQAAAHASLAAVDLAAGHFDEALAHIGTAREIDGANLDYRIRAARIHRLAGAPSRTLELLVPLPSETRASETVTAEIASAFGAMDEHDRAAEAWLHRYRLRRDDPDIWRTLVSAGHALVEAGRREDAALWLNQARMLAPDASEIRELETRIGRSETGEDG
ncbi:MAG: tetratricopeptide repeat protein [Planctomycetota bacterium]